MPKVSVLLPVFNAEQYLAEAVESILGQSFEDFELLAHDDGSTDSSLDLLRDFARRDSRVVVSSAANRGITPTLNLLIQNAQAPYLARMDSDDVALPRRLQLQVDYLDENPDCVVVGGWIELIDPEGRSLRVLRLPLVHEEIDAKNLSGTTSIAHPAVMMRGSAILGAGGYRESLPQAQDIDLWLRLAEIGQLANLDQVLLKYRLHFKSVGVTKLNEQIGSHQRAAEDTYARRGISGQPKISPPSSALENRNIDHWRRWGWWALQDGHTKTARLYARRVLRADPINIESWRPFACAVRGY